MNAKRMVFGSILLALLLVTLSAPYAFGCAPDDMDSGKCIPGRWRAPTAAPTPVAIAIAAPQPPPRSGANPENAMDPPGTWQTLAPDQKLWYRIHDSGMQLDIWVSANGQQGLQMAIYAPDQRDLYGPPVGRGSYNRTIPDRDLSWSGRTSAWGVWYAVVSNTANIPISFTLSYKRTLATVANRCSECHGYEIEWDRCVDRGSAWCEDLQDSYTKPNQ